MVDLCNKSFSQKELNQRWSDSFGGCIQVLQHPTHSTFMERVVLDKGNCSIIFSPHLDSAEAELHLNICGCRARMGELVVEAPSAALADILSFYWSCWIFVTYLPSMASIQTSYTYPALMQEPGLSDLRSTMGSHLQEGVTTMGLKTLALIS